MAQHTPSGVPQLKKHREGLDRQVTVKNLPQITTWQDLRNNISQHLFYTLSRDRPDATNKDLYNAFALTLRDQMARMWVKTQRQIRDNNRRITYYLSMEFYLGRMMKNAIVNLGLEDIVQDTMQELNIDLKSILPCETDAGLGNGGLGRLAACFLDSMATLDIPCYGYGLRYEYGIFEQVITEYGSQVERADNWLENGYAWEIPRTEDKVEVKMYGHMENGQWVNNQTVWAIPYDIPIPGFKNGVVGTLRLWKAKATNELSFEMFNTGDYVKAVEEKNRNENITRVLYPDDRTLLGKELRLKQEYFLVAASIRDILNRHLKNESYYETQSNDEVEEVSSKLKRMPTMFEENEKIMEYLRKLVSKVAIQLNDTHPSLAIPELMRVLMDEYKLSWDSAWLMVKQCFHYTNHTVLPEALEKWPVEMLNKVLPRHLDIIYQINSTHLAEIRVKMSNDEDLVRRMSIVEESGQKSIRMAYLSIVGSQRVNGVARVHSELIRRTLFKDFVDFYPNKNHFTNVTNGVTPRRWIKECNPELSELISKHIESDWVVDLPKLAELNKLKTDSKFLANLQEVKMAKKKQFCEFIKNKFHIQMNPEWMLSVQVKRIHEYKRQLMNVLHVIMLYNQARKGQVLHPRTFVIGGKAAPAYERAKKIITLICKVSKAIDADVNARKYLKLIMLPNYDVSSAEVVIPAADLSEQISLAGMEASGTGNMKFMMNGALTIGTLDGANMEISESVEEKSMFRFGMKIEDVPVVRQTYNEDRNKILEESEEIQEALNMINNGYFMPEDPDRFKDIVYDLRNHDYYMLIKDLGPYAKAQDKAAKMYYGAKSKEEWFRASLDNIANSGRFSSDEAIKNYAKHIWNVEFTDRSSE